MMETQGIFSRFQSARVCRARRAFTLVEIIVSLFVLALVAIVCIAVVSSRDTDFGKTAAMSDAPAAIDALQVELDSEDVETLYEEISSTGAIRVAYKSSWPGESYMPWRAADPLVLRTAPSAEGAIYVAVLSKAKLYEKKSAVEFDVTLGWVAPGLSTETADHLRARLLDAERLCAYRAIVLRK